MMDELLFFYVGGLIFSILLSLIRLGYESSSSDGIQPILNGTVYFCMSVVWPLTVTAYIIIGFVRFPYMFGKKLEGYWE
jgi:hypothetical protein